MLLFAERLADVVGSPSASAARLRMAALAVGVAVLLVGPAIWSVETLGHPTSSTFPAGGPESASAMGGPGGGFGGPGGGSGGPPSFGAGEGGAMPSFGGSNSGLGAPPSMSGSEGGSTGEGGTSVGELFGESSGAPSIGAGGMSAGGGGIFGGENLSAIVEYTEAHGGGTIAVDSQSGAASSIIESGAEVAGIGGFSGKESSVSAQWLEQRIEAGDITWIYTSGLGGSGFAGMTGAGAGGDTRTGSESAIDTVVKQCTAIESSAYSSTSSTSGSTGSGTLYKCGGS